MGLNLESRKTMKERPILFKAEMVNAILDGSKTQTRRVFNHQPDEHIELCTNTKGEHLADDFENNLMYFKCPYGKIGDQLWVRENFAFDSQMDNIKPSEMSKGEPVYYPANRELVQKGCSMISRGKTRPSIFMPHWASRIQLEITDIRVERLQDISGEDARAEGCSGAKDISPYQEFYELWKSINGADSWDSNPWVWIVEFQRVKI